MVNSVRHAPMHLKPGSYGSVGQKPEKKQVTARRATFAAARPTDVSAGAFHWPSGSGYEIATVDLRLSTIWKLISLRRTAVKPASRLNKVIEDGVEAIILDMGTKSPISFLVEPEAPEPVVSVVIDSGATMRGARLKLGALLGNHIRFNDHALRASQAEPAQEH